MRLKPKKLFNNLGYWLKNNGKEVEKKEFLIGGSLVIASMLLVQEEAMVESDLLPLKHKSDPIIRNLMTKTKIFDRISNFETDYCTN